MGYDYSIGLNREQHGLCTRSSKDLPAALQTRINDAVESVERIQGTAMLEFPDQVLEDELILRLGSQLIEFAKPELSAPTTDGTYFTVKQTREILFCWSFGRRHTNSLRLSARCIALGIYKKGM